MLLVIGLAVTAYGVTRLKRDFVDFEVMQQAGVRVLTAEPLYRDDDGHFQYKYLPAYAFAMTPFARIDIEISKAIWFAISVGLLIYFVQQSIDLLPDRRRSARALYWLIGVLITKFVVTELVNGQCNILRGVLALTGCDAARRGRHVQAGVFVALAGLPCGDHCAGRVLHDGHSAKRADVERGHHRVATRDGCGLSRGVSAVNLHVGQPVRGNAHLLLCGFHRVRRAHEAAGIGEMRVEVVGLVWRTSG